MSNKQETRLSTLSAELKTFAKSANARAALEAQNIPGSEKNRSQDVVDPSSLGIAGKDTETVPAGSQPTGSNTASSSTDQAVPGENLLESGNSAEPTDMKPLTKADVDQKAAASVKLANALSARILEHNKYTQKQAAAKPAARVSNKSAHAHTPFDLTLTTDVLAKIAAVVCSTAEGSAFAEQKVAEFIGEQEAQSWMGFLATQNEEAEKQASEYAEGAAYAEALIDDDMNKQASEYAEGAAYAESLINNEMSKQASEQEYDQYLDQVVSNPMFKQGQAIGMDSLGIDPSALGQGDEGGYIPDEGGEDYGGEGGEIPEEGDEGGEGDEGDEISPEDIVGALQMMVESGEIPPEAAAKLLQQLMEGEDGGEGGEMPPEGMPPEGMPPEGMPPEAMMPEGGGAGIPEEEPKMASARLGAELRAHFAKFASN